MARQSVVQRRVVLIAFVLLIFLLLLAAAINVPWAVTFCHSRTTIRQVPTATIHGPDAARPWPSATPHDEPWPTPTHWDEGREFGFRHYNVFSSDDQNRTRFQMTAQHLGWPLPVIEKKRMGWDWDDPALAGPESDPGPSLLVRGLILNPLLLGGGAWLVLVFPWIAGITFARAYRRRRNRCLDCGYPAKSGSAVCTECGSSFGRSATTPTPSSDA